MPSKSSRNAVTHGIHTSIVVLRNESNELFLSLEDDHVALWNPVGPLESLLVAEIVTAEWRLRRTWQTETAALDFQMDRDAPAFAKEAGRFDEPVRTAVAFTHIASESFFLDNMHRNEVRFTRMIDRAAARLTALQERRLRKAQPLQDQQNKTILQNEKDTPSEVRQ